MIDKEAAELRRRFRQDRCSINTIYGCYVNSSGEIVTTFRESLLMLPADEQEKYLNLLKKSISGKLGGTLSDVSFTTAQVQNSEEHGLLMKLRNSKLEDADARNALFLKISRSLKLEDNGYLIVLAYDCYDVPFRSSDGAAQADAGDTQFSYFLCSVCPVRETKPSLRYDTAAQVFRNHGTDWVVSSPEVGFLFPAFDDRATNLYGALYFSRSRKIGYDSLVESVFHTKPPMAVAAQEENFRSVLTESLAEECSPAVVQHIHTQLRQMADAHKEARRPEPLRVGCEEVRDILSETGVSEPKLASFRIRYEQAFGTDSELPPQNLLNAGRLEYKTPSVVIRLDPERSDLVELREMGGTKYLVIRADEGVEINGIPVQA